MYHDDGVVASSSAPVVGGVPELTEELIRYEWCRLHRGIEGEPDEGAFSSFEEGVKQGYDLAASRLSSIKPGEVVETCEWAADDDGDEDREYETQYGQRFMLNYGGPADNSMNYCHYCGKRIALRAQAPASGKE